MLFAVDTYSRFLLKNSMVIGTRSVDIFANPNPLKLPLHLPLDLVFVLTLCAFYRCQLQPIHCCGQKAVYEPNKR